jgi:hypothetical protein
LLSCVHFIGIVKEDDQDLFRIRFPPQFEGEKNIDIHHATEQELTHALNLYKTVSKSTNLKKSNTDDKVN